MTAPPFMRGGSHPFGDFTQAAIQKEYFFVGIKQTIFHQRRVHDETHKNKLKRQLI